MCCVKSKRIHYANYNIEIKLSFPNRKFSPLSVKNTTVSHLLIFNFFSPEIDFNLARLYINLIMDLLIGY